MIEQPEQPQPKPKKKLHIRGFLNSPYVLLTLPLLIGGFFLVLNPQYIVLAVNNPYATVCILSIPLAIFLVKIIINFFSVIEQWIRLQFEKARNAKRGQFLEFVIAVFMFVSVCEGGPFFNKVQGNILGGALGYITVFAFDLVAVVCMKSRAKMLRKGHDRKAFVYQMGVWLCALVSIYANFYSAIQNLHSILANPDILAILAPLAGVAFPVMIIFLSYATDADEDDVDDPDVYRQEQEKLVDFIRAKREIAEKILQERVKLNLLREREFLLKSILFTKKKVSFVIETVTAKVLETVNEEIKSLKTEITKKEQEIRVQAQTIATQVQMIQVLAQEVKSLSVDYGNQYQEVVAQVNRLLLVRNEVFQVKETLAQQQRIDLEEITRLIDASQEETIVLFQEQLNDLLCFAENETKEKTFPVIDDETECEGNDLECDTDPYLTTYSKNATVNETDDTTNITFLQNSGKTQNATKGKTKNTRGMAARKAATIIKNNPGITPIDLAKKAKITSTYARKLLALHTTGNATMNETMQESL